MYGLLTKREVKVAGYWPISFVECLWTETLGPQTSKKKEHPAILTKQAAWSIKDSRNFSSGA